MTNRELLELAAKAAVIDYVFCETVQEIIPIENGYPQHHWNPLKDDGDALRLAVKLELCISNHYGSMNWAQPTPPNCMVGYSLRKDHGANCYADHNGDPYAATRRAIVRAAAEIGKSMP